MKKIHLLSLGGLFISSIVFAAPPVTLDDVNNQLDLVANGPEYSPPQSEREQLWKDFNAVPVSGDSSQKTITRFSVSNGTKRLQPASTHTCVVGQVGGFYGRGLKGIEVDVYQQSGYWYLKALHNSGGSSNWATATCWNN
jgi:hypothetical protein